MSGQCLIYMTIFIFYMGIKKRMIAFVIWLSYVLIFFNIIFLHISYLEVYLTCQQFFELPQ